MSRKKTQLSDGGGKKSLLIVLVMLIAIGACALSGFTLYEIRTVRNHVTDNNPADSQANLPGPVTPLYLPLETFTVSLKPTADDSDRVLYIGLTLRVKDEGSKALIEEFLPEIRGRLLMLFSQRTADELSTNEGKDKLMADIKQSASQPLADGKSAVITDALLNAFILR